MTWRTSPLFIARSRKRKAGRSGSQIEAGLESCGQPTICARLKLASEIVVPKYLAARQQTPFSTKTAHADLSRSSSSEAETRRREESKQQQVGSWQAESRWTLTTSRILHHASPVWCVHVVAKLHCLSRRAIGSLRARALKMLLQMTFLAPTWVIEVGDRGSPAVRRRLSASLPMAS